MQKKSNLAFNGVMKVCVVIPTYNERSNIEALVTQISSLVYPLEILVVDDQSPDGTGEVVQELMRRNDKVFLLSRDHKQGLGPAYKAGFQWALARDYSHIVQMDADLSHRPLDLGRMIDVMMSGDDQFDFIVGSRYIRFGKTVHWDWRRKLLSRGGSLYSQMILGRWLNDWTGGFNLWKKEVLLQSEYLAIRSDGYSFQIELKYRAIKKGFRVKETPIQFIERNQGQSKMSARIVFEAIYKVWWLRWGMGE